MSCVTCHIRALVRRLERSLTHEKSFRFLVFSFYEATGTCAMCAIPYTGK
jgi:hypothetical protein